MTWERLPAIPGRIRGCLNAGCAETLLSMDACLAVGFGMVSVKCDKRMIWCGDDETRTVAEFEAMAAADPDHDWRIQFYAPLSDTTYQRQDTEKWVLVQQGQGFA
jgi:hypothetical protein